MGRKSNYMDFLGSIIPLDKLGAGDNNVMYLYSRNTNLTLFCKHQPPTKKMGRERSEPCRRSATLHKHNYANQRSLHKMCVRWKACFFKRTLEIPLLCGRVVTSFLVVQFTLHLHRPRVANPTDLPGFSRFWSCFYRLPF